MTDFADTLKRARQDAGLNQSELAERTGLTGSYISVLESRRKPPPSDKVLKRLADALDCPKRELLEVAHLDRTPEDIRKKIRSLDRQLNLERRLTGHLLTDLLPSSLWHFWRVRGFHEYGLEKIRLDAKKKRILRKVLRRIGHLTSRDDFEEQSRIVIQALPSRDRAVLAQVLPELVPEEAPAGSGAGRETAAPLLDGPPGKSGVRKARRHCAVDRESYCSALYFLEARDEEMLPRIERGDLLLVNPDLAPSAGDLVVVRKGKSYTVRHYVDAPSGHLLAASDPRVAPVRSRSRDLMGLVVEIRRRLR